jgi:gamma-glutamyl hercynylcysteine S-oxide synthase
MVLDAKARTVGRGDAVSWQPSVRRLTLSSGPAHASRGQVFKMHDAEPARAAVLARLGPPLALAEALAASRADTLATFAAYEHTLPGLEVPLRPELNPPLWELGHIGWFQEYWIDRNPERARGDRADPDAPRRPPQRAGADALYNSRQLEASLALLRKAGSGDEDLYFFRLALLHEDMHHEAALYMAQGLGIPIQDPRWRAGRLPEPAAPLTVPTCRWTLGSAGSGGFAFDNERPACAVELNSFAIDRQAVRWSEYLPFIEAGGYEQPRWWSEAGARWRAGQPVALPRYLRLGATGWQRWRDGAWGALALQEAASHLTLHEAEAWCRWAGRRLPTEAEWECAAISAPDSFRWGDVWEWTASAFAPFPGFEPHPYRDYSAPWFDGRPVLRGASHCTQPRMRHPRYRNFFVATRNDVPAGLRSCAL